MPAAIASKARSKGLIPPPAAASSGGGGGGTASTVWTGGGGASTTGSTHPPGACAVAAAAAAPHIAAAGAPLLIAVSTAQGSTGWNGAGVDATAAVELNRNEPAATTPRIPFNRWIAISFLRCGGIYPRNSAKHLVHSNVSCHCFDNEFLSCVACLQHPVLPFRQGGLGFRRLALLRDARA